MDTSGDEIEKFCENIMKLADSYHPTLTAVDIHFACGAVQDTLICRYRNPGRTKEGKPKHG